MITNQESKNLVDNVFAKIILAQSIFELENILDNFNIEEKYRIKTIDYPKIEFKITSEEIDNLVCKGIIDAKFNFVQSKISELNDPLSKIFYSTSWKNGDLKKIKHIIEGIKEGNIDNESKKNGLVFHQFGKYLTKIVGEPIIDQHVLRAFNIFQTDLNDYEVITKSRKLEAINKNHKGLIRNYKNWLKSDKINDNLRKEPDYAYHIDKILFAIGKSIKKK